MWRDPMDELIDDLEQALPAPPRTAGRIVDPLYTLQRLREKCLRGIDYSSPLPPVDPDDPEVQRDREEFERAIRQLGRQPRNRTPGA